MQGLTLFERSGATVGQTTMLEVVDAAQSVLAATPREGDDGTLPRPGSTLEPAPPAGTVPRVGQLLYRQPSRGGVPLHGRDAGYAGIAALAAGHAHPLARAHRHQRDSRL